MFVSLTSNTAHSDGSFSSVDVTFADGTTSPMLIFPAHGQLSVSEPNGPSRRGIVIWPGFGVGARYYRPIAQALANKGFDVAIGELHGQGKSSAVASRSHQFGYAYAAEEVYAKQIAAARRAWNAADDQEVTLLCHSMGGQIASLYMTTDDADVNRVTSMVAVGAGAPYFRHFRGKNKWRLRLGGGAMGRVSQMLGYWPGHPRFDLAGYGRQSGRHIVEWSHYMRKGILKPTHTDVDYDQRRYYCTKRILFTRFATDEDCPPLSALSLQASLPNAETEFLNLPEPLGHNRWAREPEPMVTICERWIFGQSVSEYGKKV